MGKFSARYAVLVIASGAIGAVHAAAFDDSVRSAVLTNPDVLVKWHQFKSAVQDREISWGRYLPTLDVLYGSGRETRHSPLYTTPPVDERSYHFNQRQATLRQNIFDGLATTNDVRRLEHASMVRFFELQDASEQAAYEATRAYIDVWRYRQLLSFAEENYATHRLIYDKIKERVKAGAGRRVDLETAAGRLALSESNLLTEASNLHDVSVRFQRVVGTPPPQDVPDLPQNVLAKKMPSSPAEAVQRGLGQAPQLKAALQNIYSATRQVDVQKAAYAPKVDAYLQQDRESNTGGFTGPTKATTLGLTVTWNLFNGRQDTARTGQAVAQLETARDLREKVCRDVRQNSSMAFNDQKRLTAQLPLLDQHQLSTDKAREAFRRQFEIGQRTLLDVLDTENEFYTARRDYLNGEADLRVAQAKYLATVGELLGTLKLQQLDALPFDTQAASEEKAEACPPEPIVLAEKKEAQTAPAGPALKDYVVLLENPDGTTGKVLIKGDQGDQVVEKPYMAVPLNGSQPAVAVSTEKVNQDFGETIAARPVLPNRFSLQFQNGSAELTAESKATLPKVLESIAQHPIAEIDVIGHTDTVGSDKHNDALGLRRAQLVTEKIKSLGAKVKSVTTESRGEKDLLIKTPDNTPEPKNRRVVISVR